MKLNKLDWRLLLLGEHCYLDTSDECYYADRYECHQREGIKPLILPLKRGEAASIAEVAAQLKNLIPPHWLQNYTFVAMPSSSGEGGPVRTVLERLPVADLRDLVLQNRRTLSSHTSWRVSPIERRSFLCLNLPMSDPAPKTVVIVDDVLTTGSHFRAAKMVLREQWPHLRVIGLFIARVCSRHGISCYVNGAKYLTEKAPLSAEYSVPTCDEQT